MGLIGSIRLLAVTTDGAGAAGVAWVNRDQEHSCLLRLVGHEGAKLPKGPTVAQPSLLTPNRYSLADVGQLLHREGLACCVRLVNEPFADAVVYVPLEAVFRTGKLAEPPAGAAGVRCLEPLAMLEAPLPQALDSCPTVRLALAISSQVDQPQINAQEAGRFLGAGVALVCVRCRYICPSRWTSSAPPISQLVSERWRR